MRRRALPALLAALLLAACGALPEADSTGDVAPAPATQPPSPPAEAPSAPLSSAAPDRQVPTCDPGVAEAIGETVDAQLRAFGEGDYRAALGYASDVFQSTVTLRTFRQIIREGYPDVADAVGHEVLDCRQLDEANAQALVTVTGRGGTTTQLGYRFVRQPDGWRVDGASALSRAELQDV